MSDDNEQSNRKDGSERLSSEPVVLSFAFSHEEWAQLSAGLTHVTEVITPPMSDTLRELVDTCARMHRQIDVAMNKLYIDEKGS